MPGYKIGGDRFLGASRSFLKWWHGLIWPETPWKLRDLSVEALAMESLERISLFSICVCVCYVIWWSEWTSPLAKNAWGISYTFFQNFLCRRGPLLTYFAHDFTCEMVQISLVKSRILSKFRQVPVWRKLDVNWFGLAWGWVLGPHGIGRVRHSSSSGPRPQDLAWL